MTRLEKSLRLKSKRKERINIYPLLLVNAFRNICQDFPGYQTLSAPDPGITVFPMALPVTLVNFPP